MKIPGSTKIDQTPFENSDIYRLLIHFAACDLEKPLPQVSVDWKQALQAIQKHLITGLATYYFSNTHNPDYPPPAFQRAIKLLHYKNTLAMEKKYQTFGVVAGHLLQNNMDFMVVKGPILAHTIYPVPALRYFGDLDIMVRERDRNAVDTSLNEVAYRIKQNTVDHFPSLIPQVLSIRHTQYFNQQSGFPVEIHWENYLLDDMVLRDIESVWRRSMNVSIGGIVIKSPSLEDHLLHLCAHAHKHRFTRLFWLSDLLILIRDHTDEFDWDVFLRTVDQEEVKIPVYYSFKLLTRLFDQKFPAEVMNSVRPDGFRRWWHERCIPQNRTIGFPGEYPPISFMSPPLFKSVILNLLVMGRRADKLHFLIRVWFPTPGWLRQRYHISPDRSVFPFYFLRLFEGISFLLAVRKRKGPGEQKNTPAGRPQ